MSQEFSNAGIDPNDVHNKNKDGGINLPLLIGFIVLGVVALAAAKEYDLAKSNYDEAYKQDNDLATRHGSVRNDIENTNNKTYKRLWQS